MSLISRSFAVLLIAAALPFTADASRSNDAPVIKFKLSDNLPGKNSCTNPLQGITLDAMTAADDKKLNEELTRKIEIVRTLTPDLGLEVHIDPVTSAPMDPAAEAFDVKVSYFMTFGRKPAQKLVESKPVRVQESDNCAAVSQLQTDVLGRSAVEALYVASTLLTSDHAKQKLRGESAESRMIRQMTGQMIQSAKSNGL